MRASRPRASPNLSGGALPQRGPAKADLPGVLPTGLRGGSSPGHGPEPGQQPHSRPGMVATRGRARCCPGLPVASHSPRLKEEQASGRAGAAPAIFFFFFIWSLQCPFPHRAPPSPSWGGSPGPPCTTGLWSMGGGGPWPRGEQGSQRHEVPTPQGWVWGVGGPGWEQPLTLLPLPPHLTMQPQVPALPSPCALGEGPGPLAWNRPPC